MNITSTPVSPLFDQTALRLGDRATERAAGPTSSFSGILRTFVKDVNDLKMKAGQETERFLTGETSNIHQVMVASEQAGIATDLLLEIRNKAIEGYQETMRMQV